MNARTDDRGPDVRRGLTSEQVASRAKAFGKNRVRVERAPHVLGRLASQFVHLFALMLWAAAGLSLLGRMPQLASAITAVIVVNGVFAFAQEYRADRAARALARLMPQRATVVRDGERIGIDAEDLVPDDVLVLTAGDRISADAVVISSDALRADHSMLTGESEPVERAARTGSDELFAGTYVVSGSGIASVVHTGARTRLAALSRLTASVRRRPTPLRRELDRAVRAIAGISVVTGLAFLIVSIARGTPLRDGALFAVGVIVALVPEGLLPTLTLSLAMSARRMASRNALARNLEAVETLGATTVICSDKTGTITANQMTVRAIVAGGASYEVTGVGYDAAGAILSDGRPLTDEDERSLLPLLRAMALCNDARIEGDGPRARCAGDPTEGALLVAAQKAGVERRVCERRSPRVRTFPFDSQRRLMTTIHALPGPGFEAITKGSPEIMASRVRGGARDAMPPVEELAAGGLRLLAVARRALAAVPATAAEAERDLELLGVVGIEDPVRGDVPDAIARCEDAGIRVVMVTGDHPATAVAVGRAAGLRACEPVLANELPDDDDELAELLMTKADIVARVEPEAKLRIARALQRRGEVVAMTGDGVNDAPALRQADIGVAMGRSGTDVAREAADLILLDDSFVHIVEAIEEGRAAFDNIKRFLTYHLTDNVAELAPFVVWAFASGAFPLMLGVLQILALDIGTDLLPALALGAERPEPRVMRRPPRPRRARLFDREVLVRAFGVLGPTEAVVSLATAPLAAAALFGWHPGLAFPSDARRIEVLSGIVFASIVAMQMANAFECRSRHLSPRTLGLLSNRMLAWAVVTEAGALAAFVYLPPLRRALHQGPIPALGWAFIACAPAVFVAVEERRKALARRRGRRAR